MRTFFTTEEILDKILRSRDTYVWKQILKQQDQVFVYAKSKDGNWDRNNKVLFNFHQSGKKIFSYNEFFDAILSENTKRVTGLSMPIFLLDIDAERAKKISDNYGVCCYSVKDKTSPFIANRGWSVETTDDDVDNSWSYFYQHLNPTSNSILMIDRYLFSSEWNKKNGDPDDYLRDSFFNIQNILEDTLPAIMEGGVMTVTIVFSDDTIKGGKNDYRAYTFSDIVTKMQTIQSEVKRPYSYNVELISINKDCAYYNDTHDRFVITNYSITEAAHKLKAFNKNKQVITKQKLSFDYSYSKGIAPDDISSVPVQTQIRVIDAIKKLLNDPKSANHIKHSINGVMSTSSIAIENRLLTGE